mgnify:CR=1 FL=1|jgi:hypothetical protein
MSSYVRYIDKTREYYLAQGYETPYRWAHFDEVPFTSLKKPLSECCITITSTSDVALKSEQNKSDENGHKLIGNVYEIPSDVKATDLFSKQEHYDRHATNLDDVNAYFPVTRLHEFVVRGRLGSVAPYLYGVYTAYSQKRTLEIDAPEVLKRCRENNVDVAVLTPV